jgi:hypothetical protein
MSLDEFLAIRDEQTRADASVMVAMQWSWRDLCECPEEVIDAVITRLQSEQRR